MFFCLTHGVMEWCYLKKHLTYQNGFSFIYFLVKRIPLNKTNYSSFSYLIIPSFQYSLVQTWFIRFEHLPEESRQGRPIVSGANYVHSFAIFRNSLAIKAWPRAIPPSFVGTFRWYKTSKPFFASLLMLSERR